MKKEILTVVFLSGAAIGMSAPVKSFVGAHRIEGISEASIEYTAKDYVQDGLIAMWDGIENAGWGVHEPESSEWVDLIGTNNITNPTGDWQWNDDHIYLTLTGYGRTLRTIGSPQTMEVVCYATEADGTGSGDRGGFISVGLGYPLLSAYIGETKWDLGVGYMNAYSSVYNYKSFLAGNTASVTYVTTDSETYIYFNGLHFKNQVKKNVGNYQLYIGQRGTAKNSKVGGNIYCIRLYNRPLSANEIDYNWKIDKRRFGI